MTRIDASIDIDRAVEVVFDVLADVRRLPEFSPMTVAVTDAPERLERPGQRWRQQVRLLGREFGSAWEVVALQAPVLLEVAGTSDLGGTIHLTERLSPLGAGRSRFDYRFEYELPGSVVGAAAGRLVRGRARKETEQILRDLKAMVERSPS